MINIKNAAQIMRMQRAGQIVAKAHRAVKDAICPGITTQQLDAIALEVIRREGAVPSFKGYGGFPMNICVSVNNEVIHGIPSKRRLLEGDIVGVDIGAYLDGFHGDAAATYGVGKISPAAAKLIEVTERAFFAGFSAAREGNRVSDISAAVQNVAETAGYGVVRDFVGHGVGAKLHEDPEVPNFVRRGGKKGVRLCAGMTLAIEPMINQGSEQVSRLSDGWTVVTADGKLSAHFEHSIAITKGDAILLTVEY